MTLTPMTNPKIRVPLLLIFVGGVSIATADQPWNSPDRATAKFWIGVGLILLGALAQYREIRMRPPSQVSPPPNEEL